MSGDDPSLASDVINIDSGMTKSFKVSFSNKESIFYTFKYNIYIYNLNIYDYS